MACGTMPTGHSTICPTMQCLHKIQCRRHCARTRSAQNNSACGTRSLSINSVKNRTARPCPITRFNIASHIKSRWNRTFQRLFFIMQTTKMIRYPCSCSQWERTTCAARTTTGIGICIFGTKNNMERLHNQKVYHNAVANNIPYPSICQDFIIEFVLCLNY